MNHILQSHVWKIFKEMMGHKIVDLDEYFFYTSTLPYIKKEIGYMARPNLEAINWDKLLKYCKVNKLLYLKIEPTNFKSDIPNTKEYVNSVLARKGVKAKVVNDGTVHLPHTTVIDLTRDLKDIMDSMKKNHRYSIRVAYKNEVDVRISEDNNSLNDFFKLYNETVLRKGFVARPIDYVQKVWETFKEFKDNPNNKEGCDVKVATAYYKNSPIASSMILTDKDTIYYLYAGSSEEYRDLMPSYGLIWGLIEWGKTNNFKYLDLWGVKEGEGYSRFKTGFGGEVIEYADSLDIVFNPILYRVFNLSLVILRKIKGMPK